MGFGDGVPLELVELPDPTPGAGEARVRVRAVTVNPADAMLRAGLLRSSITGPLPHVPGLEFAGEVDATGAGSVWAFGDSVAGVTSCIPSGRGAQAEYVVAPDDSLVRIPAGSTMVEAATLPMNGLTVVAALEALGLAAGDTLLVTGAAGAVGGYATQLGAAAGLRVIAVASREAEELVRGLGAAAVVPRDADLAAAVRSLVPAGVDGVVDGALIAQQVMGAVRDGGRIAILRDLELDHDRSVTTCRVRVRDRHPASADLRRLVDAVEAGKLTLRVGDVLPAEQANRAYQLLARPGAGARGRVVLSF